MPNTAENQVPETSEIESTDIRIKKVKKNAKGVMTIHYQKPNGDDFDDYTMVCKSYPHPDLLSALDALVPHVSEICELPMSYRDNLIVSGVSFSYKDDNMGAVITAQKKLSSHPAPLLINTPHKPVAPYSEGGDESATLTSDCVIALENLQREASLYITGKRGVAPVEEGDATVGDDGATHGGDESDD